MKRTERLKKNLKELEIHPWLKRLFQKLTKEDRERINKFIDTYGDDSPVGFEIRLNRLFMDQPEKPKRWKETMEILTNLNSMTKREEKSA